MSDDLSRRQMLLAGTTLAAATGLVAAAQDKVPGKDVEIQFTGLRPGEKMTEELLTAGERGESAVHLLVGDQIETAVLVEARGDPRNADAGDRRDLLCAHYCASPLSWRQ